MSRSLRCKGACEWKGHVPECAFAWTQQFFRVLCEFCTSFCPRNGLRYLNTSGRKIIHYDIKPSNVFFNAGQVGFERRIQRIPQCWPDPEAGDSPWDSSPYGVRFDKPVTPEVKIGDFGLSKMADQSPLAWPSFWDQAGPTSLEKRWVGLHRFTEKFISLRNSNNFQALSGAKSRQRHVWTFTVTLSLTDGRALHISLTSKSFIYPPGN